MAPPPQPRHRARHRSSASWTLRRELAALVRGHAPPPGLVLAKAGAVTAAGGLVLTLLLPGGQASASVDAVTATGTIAQEAAGAAAAASLNSRAQQQASRSLARAAVAVQAPNAAVPAAAPTFGAMSFTAVEKPKPKPAASSSAGGSEAGSAARQGSGGGYDWAAANACSCARGLTQGSLKVLAAVKASFPGMTNIGGVRADSLPDHPSGRALDFMTTNRGYGDAIAGLLISRAGELNIEYIIWYQRIWMPGKGWKQMSNRGGATANHMDHVHVTVRR